MLWLGAGELGWAQGPTVTCAQSDEEHGARSALGKRRHGAPRPDAGSGFSPPTIGIFPAFASRVLRGKGCDAGGTGADASGAHGSVRSVLRRPGPRSPPERVPREHGGDPGEAAGRLPACGLVPRGPAPPLESRQQLPGHRGPRGHRRPEVEGELPERGPTGRAASGPVSASRPVQGAHARPPAARPAASPAGPSAPRLPRRPKRHGFSMPPLGGDRERTLE